MRKPRFSGTLIGNKYPFFLNNSNLKESFYLYQVTTPKMLSDFTPLLTLTKVGEKTVKGQFCATEEHMNHADIISTLLRLRNKKDLAKVAAEYLETEILNREEQERNGKDVVEVYENGYDFPLFEMDNSSNTTKAVIVGLRDALRWSRYRFYPGNYVDMLVSPTQFAVLKVVKAEGDGVKLTITGVYNNTDVTLSNPLNVDLASVDFPKDVFEGKTRASELNRALRAFEWRSFDNNEY